MTPQIQPGIGFVKDPPQLCQPFRDVPGHTEETISVRSVDHTVAAFRTGALQNPIRDPIGKNLGSWLQRIGDVAQLLQFIHDLQGFLAVSNVQNAFQAHNTTSPHSGLYSVLIAAISRCSLPEGSPGYKLQQVTQQALQSRDFLSGHFYPWKF